ncbi:MAG: sugar porter family MFS transporter [Gaiellales bacterium]
MNASTNLTNPNTSPLVEFPEAGLRQIRRWGLLIVIGSFLFGYDTAVISGSLLFITDEFRLDAFEQGSVVSVLLLGAMAGALFTGRISDRFGRRAVLALLGIVFTVGIAIAAVANGYWMLMIGRIVMGLGVGGVSAAVPTYLSEISPPQIRGRMLTLNQLMLVIGMLCAYIVNLIFSESENWRAMFWIGVVPAAALVLGTLRLPESPEWLITKGRIQDAKDVLASVAGSDGADAVIERHQRAEEKRRAADAASGDEQRDGWSALKAREVRPALVVGLTLAALQQFAGINTILYYAPTIMAQNGLSASNAIFYSVFIGAINLVMTVASLRLVDRVGRRPLLLGSLIGMGISLVLLGLTFTADLPSEITLICMLLYIMSFAIGMGPVFWVILGEVFPPRERAVGVSAGSTMNWSMNFVVTLLFLPVVAAIGQGQTFWLFAVICAAGVWFVGRYVPETRERNFDDIHAELETRWRRRSDATE